MNVVGHWCGMFVPEVCQPDKHVRNQIPLIIDRRGSTYVASLTQKNLLDGRLLTSGY